MKYTVRIADRSYEVEIEDVEARPVIARVDGQTFEVHPENGIKLEIQTEARPAESVDLPKPRQTPGLNASEMSAPLPGTVTEVFVRAGEQIESGQVILVIEAMKMKNSIRSTRAGKIMEILVSPGQTVAHKQALVRFG
ncbi:MAG TPA: biotin/lipoyl-containing protein [Anaerolineales bacterium]|nr:biotin/lipoyl-containing protein [Anaerolineales bacterium]